MSEPAKKTVSIRFDPAVYANLCEIAESEDRSVNNWVNRVVERAIATHRGNIRHDSGLHYVMESKPPTSVTAFDQMPPDMPDPVHRPLGVRLPEPDPRR